MEQLGFQVVVSHDDAAQVGGAVGVRDVLLRHRLKSRGFAVWHGNYYALEVLKWLGLEVGGGALRVGFVHFNTAEKVGRLLGELAWSE